MIWKNEEQYNDYTAARAMLRVTTRSREELDALDSTGCRLLIAAVIHQAMADHASALQSLHAPGAKALAEETEAFFRSAYFRYLSCFCDEAGILTNEKEETKDDDRA